MENDMLFRPQKKKRGPRKMQNQKKRPKTGVHLQKKQKKAKTNLVKFAPVESAK